MAETIESFVAKLQAEGIEAGKQAAEDLCAEATKEGEQIIKDAQAQAAKTIEAAQREGDNLLDRSKSELTLAARDVVLALRASLGRVLTAILSAKVKKTLANSDFLATTLHDLILAYAKADIDHSGRIEINVSPELQGELADWAIGEISRKAQEAKMSIDLKGTLSSAGFEYTITDATVEVTPESVVQAMSELVSPRLRELIEAAIGNDQPKAAKETK